MIRAKASAPGLCPKSKPEDMQKLKDFYHCIDERLVGVEAELKKYGVEKLEIRICLEQPNGAEPADAEAQGGK